MAADTIQAQPRPSIPSAMELQTGWPWQSSSLCREGIADGVAPGSCLLASHDLDRGSRRFLGTKDPPFIVDQREVAGPGDPPEDHPKLRLHRGERSQILP